MPCSIEWGVFGCAKYFNMPRIWCQYHAATNQQNVPLIGIGFSTHPHWQIHSNVIWFVCKETLTFHIDCMLSYPSTSCQTPADEWGFFVENIGAILRQSWTVITQRQYVADSLIRVLCLVQCFLHVIVYLVSLLLVDDNVDVHILHHAQQKSRPLRAAIVISVISSVQPYKNASLALMLPCWFQSYQTPSYNCYPARATR